MPPPITFTEADLRRWQKEGLITQGQLEAILAAEGQRQGERPTAEVEQGLNLVTILYYVGVSLALASEVAGRFALLLALVFISAWLTFRIPLWLYRRFQPHAREWAVQILEWGRKHPLPGRLINGLVDPSRPASLTLFVSAALLLGSIWLFLGISEDVLTGDPLVQASRNVYKLLQNLRTPWGDRIMVAFTELGDAMVTVSVIFAVSVWLILRRAWYSLGYVIAAVFFGSLVVQIIKVLFHVSRPEALYSGISAYSFPSGHATMSMVLFGFLAVLVSRRINPRWRWFPFALAGLLIIGIGFSRLYLGAHWLSDVVGGYSLGLVWVTLLAIAYKRHDLPRRPLTGLSAVVLVSIIVAGGLHIHKQMDSDIERYAPRHNVNILDAESWWTDAWRSLPENRLDLKGENEQPLNLQYAGALNVLKNHLGKYGWRKPVPLNRTTVLRWLLPEPQPMGLPILPQVHQGWHESLLLIHPSPGDLHHLLVLRLWSADSKLKSGVPVWVGTINRLEIRQYFWLMTLLRTKNAVSPELALSPEIVEPFRWKLAQRANGKYVFLLAI